jgi:UDP-3-O-[3-hydroxymyristoyl] glucosamine N-acyltransferase
MKLRDLAERLACRLEGDGEIEIVRVAGIEDAGPGDLTFVANPKYLPAVSTTRASAVLLRDDAASGASAVLRTPDPYLAFARAVGLFAPRWQPEPGVHAMAAVAADAHLGDRVSIGAFVSIGEGALVGDRTIVFPNVTIGPGARIGADCVIHSNVSVRERVTIGDRVVLQNGVVIGGDGYGFVRRSDGTHEKIPQVATVVIEDDVELGANTTVDRGALGRTRIGKGTKLDNMVHVGHNCDIGERVVIAAQTGISGSVTIEDDCVIGGQVGFGDHILVQSGAVIGSKAGVLPGKIVRPGVWWGIPIQPLDEYKRLNAHISRLPHVRQQIKDLSERIKILERQLPNSDE